MNVATSAAKPLVPLFRAAPPPGAGQPPPLTVVEAGRATLAGQLRELWAGRELLLFFAWRDVKVRYQQTALGVAWALLQPLTQMAIFAVVFGRYAGLAKETSAPYVWFVLAGLVPWTFFANALAAASHSMVASREMLTKVYFPRLVIPCAAVLAGLVELAIAFSLLLVALTFAGYASLGFVAAVPLLLLAVVAALGSGILLAACTAAYRDFRFIVPFMIQVGLFATPIVYPLSMFPSEWRWLLALNPLAGTIEALRACLLGGWTGETTLHLCLSAASGFALLWLGLDVFRRLERSLADRV